MVACERFTTTMALLFLLLCRPSCRGDVGGPFMDEMTNDRFTMLGMALRTYDCADKGGFSIFLNVINPDISAWVGEKLDGCNRVAEDVEWAERMRKKWDAIEKERKEEKKREESEVEEEENDESDEEAEVDNGVKAGSEPEDGKKAKGKSGGRNGKRKEAKKNRKRNKKAKKNKKKQNGKMGNKKRDRN